MRFFITAEEFRNKRGWGGIGTYTETAARSLASFGHEVVVFAGTDETKAFSEECNGVRIHRIPSHGLLTKQRALQVVPRSSFGSAIRYSWALRREIYRQAASLPPDVVEFPDWKAEGACTTAYRPEALKRALLVVRAHGFSKLMDQLHGTSSTVDSRLLQKLEQTSMKNADAVVPNTHWLAGKLKSLSGIHANETCFLGVDTCRFRHCPRSRIEVRKSCNLSSQEVMLLSCGRVEKRKGFEHIVLAISRLPCDLRKLCRLVIVGGGLERNAEKQRINAISQQLGVEPIMWIEPQPYDAMPKWYSAADVYVAASRGESPGLTYLEAMSCALPVVAFRDGAIPEIVRNGETGILVDPNTPEPMAAAIASVVQCRTKRENLSEAASSHVHKNFDAANCMSAQVDTYAKLLHLRRSGRR